MIKQINKPHIPKRIPSNTFFDKHGRKIKRGDKLKTNIDELLFDGIVIEEDGKLGVYFIHGKMFFTLDSFLDDFFINCEII